MAKKGNKGGLNGLPSDKGKGSDAKTNIKKVEDIVKGKGGKIDNKSYDKGKKDNTKDAGGKPKDQPHPKEFDNKNQGGGKGKGGGSSSGGGGGGDVNRQMFEFQKREAERARQEERDRKNRIKKGMGKIDESFAQFDDSFYDTREQTYKDYYMSQATPEFKKARDNLTFALARAGLGGGAGVQESSAATTRRAENEEQISGRTAAISAQAASDRSKTEAQIAAERSALVSTLNQTAQAGQIGNEATAKTQQLASAAPDYATLPDIFFGAAQGVGGLVQAGQNAQYARVFNGGSGSNPTIRNSTTIY